MFLLALEAFEHQVVLRESVFKAQNRLARAAAFADELFRRLKERRSRDVSGVEAVWANEFF